MFIKWFSKIENEHQSCETGTEPIHQISPEIHQKSTAVALH